MIWFALLSPLALVFGGAYVALSLRRLKRTLDRIEPWQLETETERLFYAVTYRKWGWTPRFDPWSQFEEAIE